MAAYKLIKFGRNEDVDTAEESIWSVGGLYTGWVAAAAATTIVSASVEDDASKTPAGTGAYTVFVQGVDDNLKLISESVTMNGQVAVTLSQNYKRVFRAYVSLAGSANTNVGAIQIKHGSTVLAQIDASAGQTLMAVYTIPLIWSDGMKVQSAYLYGHRSSMVKPNSSAGVEMHMEIRNPGGAWRIIETWGLMGAATSNVGVVYPLPVEIAPGSDIEIRATASANDCSVSGQFYMTINT